MKPSLLFLVVLCSSCAGTTEPDLSGLLSDRSLEITGTLDFGARSTLESDSVRVFLRVTNRGNSPGTLLYGCGSFAVLGVGPGGVTWDNRIPPGAACIGIGLGLSLDPGETREVSAFQKSAQEIRTDFPRGSYRVSLFLRQDGSLRRLDAGSLTL